MQEILRIATRQSPLALWQANLVARQLRSLYPELKTELVPINTQGDQDLTQALADIGGKGLFVKALQYALITNKADIAVHCIKDMSVHQHKQLTLAAIMLREDVRDVFVSSKYSSLNKLPPNAIVGTASPRRQSLIKSIYPEINIKLLRGNVNTRLAKCEAGEYDAIILAAAGLNRLSLEAKITEYLNPNTFIPAIGQGALGIECRKQDEDTQEILAPLHHAATATCIEAERTVNKILGGDCYTPIGAYASQKDDELTMYAFVGSDDGKQLCIAQHTLTNDAPEELGTIIANELLAQGASAIIKQSS